MSTVQVCSHGNYLGCCNLCDATYSGLPISVIPTALTSNAPCSCPDNLSGHDFEAFDSTRQPGHFVDAAFCRRCGKVIKLVTP